MKRIVIDARESGTSTGRYIDKLIEYLHQLKPTDEIIVLTHEHRQNFFRQVAPNFRIVISAYKEFTLDEQLGLAWQLYRLRADLVHFGMTQQPLLYWKKSITTMHDITMVRFKDPTKNDLVFTLKQWVYRLVIWWAAHKSKRVIVPTEFVKNDIVAFAHAKAAKFVVTYESADKIADSPAPVDDLDKHPFILYVGRPAPHKNLDRLVEAFAKLKKNQPKLKLVLAGRYDARYKLLADRVKKYAVPDVVFTDFVTDGGLRWLYEHASAYVFPSLSEGFGLPGLEAMQYGLPVVSSNATCLPEVYKDAVLYFDPLDTDDMASKLNQVLTDQALATKLENNSQALLHQYSWAKMAKQTLQEYVAVLYKTR
jgi:glycosyltransferase involved in cell wall biosynthesis